MKKIPFLLILLTFCFTGLFGGIFFFEHENRNALAQEQSLADGVTSIANVAALTQYLNTFGAGNANDKIELSAATNPTTFDMTGQVVTGTIGDSDNAFVGSFDGNGNVIANLTIDLSSQANNQYAGFFGRVSGATIKNVTFQNLTIKTAAASTIYAGVVAYGEECNISGVKISGAANVAGLTTVLADSSTCYAGGICGYLKNGVIEGCQIENNISFTPAKADVSNIGGLVGKAEGSSINNVQISSSNQSRALSISIVGATQAGSNAFASNLNFGGMAGTLDGGSISQIICRTDSFGEQWLFARNDGKIHNIGGVVGSISGTTIAFAISKATINVLTTESFVGNVSVGGFAGRVSQVGSTLKNVAMKNFISPQNSSMSDVLVAGEVVGKIASPVPESQNISFIHFQTNNLELFGQQGGYKFKDNVNFDNITLSAAAYDLDNLQLVEGQYTYFSNQVWDNKFGAWDFDDTWYVAAGKIYLQNFSSGFSITVTSVNETALVFEGIDGEKNGNVGLTSKSNIKYGQQVKLRYSFKIVTEDLGPDASSQETGQISMKNFYEPAYLLFNGQEVARFTMSDGQYRLSGSEGHQIEGDYDVETIYAPTADTSSSNAAQAADAEENEPSREVIGFEIIIKKLTRATEGNYAVTTSSKKFSVNISTRLYGPLKDENGDIKRDENGQEIIGWDQTVIAPGLLQADNGNPRDVLNFNNNIVYGTFYRIITQAKPANAEGEIYAPEPTTSISAGSNGTQTTVKNNLRWFIVREDGTEEKIPERFIQDGALLLDFGKGPFVGNLTIFAKYSNNSCTGIFTIDEGVQKIELGSGSIVVESSLDRRPISKDDPQLGMDIYILEGFDFDVQRFIDELGYRSTDTDSDDAVFCTFLSEEKMSDGTTCFHFIVDMTTMNWADYNNRFTVEVKTSPAQSNDNTWIWWVVGGVGGAIVLAAIIFLIVWLVRRNRFGGGGNVKFNKKNYKRMYY